MANSNYNEELGLLRRAVAEPVRQLIVVEYDILACLQQSLQELEALVPRQAHVIQKFDFRTETVPGLLHLIRGRLSAADGSRPAFLALVGPDQIEEKPGAARACGPLAIRRVLRYDGLRRRGAGI